MDGVIDKLTELLLPTLATLLTAAVMAVLRKVFQRLGLQVTAQQEDRIKTIVHDTVLRVEEYARRNHIGAADKRSTAIAEARSKLPELTDAEIGQAIDASLPIVRAKLEPPPVVVLPTEPAP